MFTLVSSQYVSEKSKRVCTIPGTADPLSNKPEDRVGEVIMKLNAPDHITQFKARLGGKSDCCSCHVGHFSAHLQDDELQIIAIWNPGAEGALTMSAHMEEGESELARWEYKETDNMPPADEELQKRARAIASHKLVTQGSVLGKNQLWIDEALWTANRLRQRHNACALQWSPKAAEAARKMADKLANASKKGKDNVLRAMETAKAEAFRNGFGLAVHFPERFRALDCMTAKTVIVDWYEQQFNPGYDFIKHGKTPGTSDFTALVWSKSTHIGMDCDSKGLGYIVACYNPPGNLNGEFMDNVTKAEGTKVRSLIKARFQAFDQDGDNRLTFAELQTMLRCLDPTFTNQELQFVMKAVDKNENGNIDFQEFMTWCFKNNQA
jgi:hypothetical protein